MSIEPALKKVVQLIHQAGQAGLTTADDDYYVFNQLLDQLQLSFFSGPVKPLIREMASGPAMPTIPDLLDDLVNDAVRRGLIEDLTDIRDVLAARLMDNFLDKPSQVNRCFWDHYQKHPRQATDWFYQLSQASQYIQTKRIARNISYQAETPYGLLDMTINLSKPEKNPRDIAAAREVRSSHYPTCLLCAENEGYPGRMGHPARSSHRLIRLCLGDEPWYFQYSPYVYYPEHCIVLSEEHRDMKVNTTTFTRLLQFIEIFPHYFIGSNADLPIVGGSILTHDHYQGGRYTFAMARAATEHPFTLPGHPRVACGIVKWPMSVIRMQAEQPADLVAAADNLTNAWRDYSDPAADILAFSDQTPHNTVTPIARRVGDLYEMDLVLRNNRQTEEHPLGLFHPHADVHHIKKENIGLIEVMGLAVLPPRLVDELAAVEKYLQGAEVTVPDDHQPWADELLRLHGPQTVETVRQVVRQAVAEKFARVLADAGVFKRDQEGIAAFRRFLTSLQSRPA